MDFDYSENGKVKISMAKYTKTVIAAFPEMINRGAATPDLDHLFQACKESKWCKLTTRDGRMSSPSCSPATIFDHEIIP